MLMAYSEHAWRMLRVGRSDSTLPIVGLASGCDHEDGKPSRAPLRPFSPD
jgi:hypothetical protein